MTQDQPRTNLHVHYSAELYDSYSAAFLSYYDTVLMARLYAMRRKYPLDGPLIDLGTGTAQLLLKMAPRAEFSGLVMVGTDYYRDMVEMALANVEAAGLSERIRIVEADVHALPFDSGSFANAISRSTIHHWADPPAALREIDRVLRPGGWAIIHDVRRDPPASALAAFNKLRADAGVEPSRLDEKYTPDEVSAFAAEAGLGGRYILHTPKQGLAALGMELFFRK
jgi:ubiquinone/menaquinone biosynthesis C-methylase UbiE